MSTDTSDVDLDRYAADNGCGTCIGTGNLTMAYASGKAAFYDTGRVLLWRGPGDVADITETMLQGHGVVSPELQAQAIATLLDAQVLQKYGEW